MSDSDTRLVRAAYTAKTLTVYQAYAPQIAEATNGSARSPTSPQPSNTPRS